MARNKKAQMADLTLMIVLLFVLAICGIIGYYLMGTMNDQLQSMPESMITNNSKDMINASYDAYGGMYDGIYFFVLIGLSIVITISAFQVRSHPVFFIISLIVMTMLGVVSVIFGDVYDQIVANATNFSTYESKMLIMPFVMDYFPFFMCILMIIIAVVMYAKPSE